ncbi:MAG: ribbon-helix-helix protein, CopG family, partial [Actinobacteria bacterium]|nr:ribbon-helix-helix protein, CopG family [Actinomycetota bacterium]
VRQARRYAERAAEGGRAAVPQETTVFTVKLPTALVARVRERAGESGSTISALVTQALTEFLARGHRKRPRR